MSGSNRPYKYGAKDRREFITEDSEVQLRSINDTNGNPVFLGRSKVTSIVSEGKWQIRKITYDSNQGVLSVEWPVNSESSNSSEYEFIWDANSELNITAISQANPAVVTVSDLGALSNGNKIVIRNVSGMTEVNFTGSNIYTVANINVGAKTFELSGVDSSAFTAYSSGGTVFYGSAVNYTYS